MAYPKSHNPFADDDDEEDFKPKRRGFDDDPDDNGMSEAERRQRYLQQEVMRAAQSAVDSSNRSLSLIYESEKMGVETAEVWHLLQLSHNTQRIPLSLERVKLNKKKSCSVTPNVHLFLALSLQELMRQGEALKRTDKMLDNMDQDLKTSQRHINSIKSVWGGFVNYFKGKPETKPPPEQPTAYQASDR